MLSFRLLYATFLCATARVIRGCNSMSMLSTCVKLQPVLNDETQMG